MTKLKELELTEEVREDLRIIDQQERLEAEEIEEGQFLTVFIGKNKTRF